MDNETRQLIDFAANVAEPTDQVWNDFDDDDYPIWQKISSSDIEFAFNEFAEEPIVIFIGKPGKETGHNVCMTPDQARLMAQRLTLMADMAEKAGKVETIRGEA